MLPSSHSFSLLNSKSAGDYLFTLRERLGTDYWMGKEYSVWMGFCDDDGEENWENIYTGKITEKTENRINGTINVSSHDVIKEFNDYKIATIIKNEDVFDYGNTEIDKDVSIQQVVKYGTHVLPTSDNKSLSDRANPFSGTIGVSAQDVKPKNDGGLLYYSKYYYWYFPFQNEMDISLYATGDLKIYYWDYRKDNRVWREFAVGDIGSEVLITQDSTNYNGVFAYIDDPTLVTGDDYSDYVDGTNNWADDNFDPVVMIESKSNFTIDTVDYLGNPVAIMYDMITSDRYIDKSNDILDYNSFSSPSITSRTWDKAFDVLDTDNAEMNTDITKETSLMDAIDSICLATGLSFFVTKKESESDDRRLKLLENSPINPYQYPLLNDQLVFSTRDRLSQYVLTTNNDYKKNIVKAVNFDSTTSTRNELDIKTQENVAVGDIDRVITLGQVSNPIVYLYNSGTFAEALAQRYLLQFNEPQEVYSVDFGKAGHNVNVGDLVDIDDAVSDNKITCQVYNTMTDVKTADKSAKLRRYTQQFGPDESEPKKLWGFWTDPAETTDEYSYWSDNPAPNGGGVNGESYHFY